MLSRLATITLTAACALLLFTSSAQADSTSIKKHKKHSHNTHPSISKQPAMPMDASVQQGIDQIINSFGRDVNIGIIVQSPATGTTLYERDATRTFMPASTLKLFTAAAALSYFNPNYTFPTQFLSNTIPQNSILPGNLYVKFSGDPMLSTTDLEAMANTLAQSGIQRVQGNLIIDDTALDHINWAPGWMWDDQILCYSAPATSIILNRNCFGFNLASGQPNTQARVEMNPMLNDISVINQAITRQANTWECPLELRPAGSNTYLLSGCLAPNHHPMALSVALNDPRRAGTQALINIFKLHGITINGNLSYAKTPDNLRVLVQHNSPPLSMLVTVMLKKSDDLIADVLFRSLGANYFNTTGTWHNGAQAVRAVLAPRTGINFNSMVMVDGAGLSRYDLVTPAQLATLLNYTYRMPTNNIFYQALPNSGIDGTLRYRLGGPTLGRIHAKTGTMVSTSGLAGYVETANHQTLIFAILINGFVGKQAAYHVLEDRICQFLATKSV